VQESQSHLSDYPQIDAEKQNQKKQHCGGQRAGSEKSPLNRIKKESPRVESMPEIVEHGSQPPVGPILQQKHK
jgi:hypothetical protein